MSNTTPKSPKINWVKPTAFARTITGKQVTVIPGNPSEGPYTNGRQILMNSAVGWDEGDRFAVLVHECCHLLYPAEYPAGNLRELANLIDDCRIERQFIKKRPNYEETLGSLAINVIANGFYTDPPKDAWAKENFDPALWALLFFRPHAGEEVRVACAEAIDAYVAEKDYRAKDPTWTGRYEKLVEDGQRITRLAGVSKETLDAWCKLYRNVFPDSKMSINQAIQVPMFSDQPVPPKGGSKDQEQDEPEEKQDAEEDRQIRIKARITIIIQQEDAGGSQGDDEGDQDQDEAQDPQNGHDPRKDEPGEDDGQDSREQGDKPSQGKGKGEKKPPQPAASSDNFGDEEEREAEQPQDLESTLQKLRDRVGNVGVAKRVSASAAHASEIEDVAGGEETSKPVEQDDEAEEEMAQQEKLLVARGIGSDKAEINVTRGHISLDLTFVNRVKMSIRKLRTLVMDRAPGRKRLGRLHMPTVISAERRGILPRKPFTSLIDELVDAPVACVVATDFSGSTAGEMNTVLNQFSHNALFALQTAGCECAEVVWNCSASITKTLDQRVGSTIGNKHPSDGGTSLVAAAAGCVAALREARSLRKVAFIFTDGAVMEREMPMLSEHLRRNGFEACLLVSVGQRVPYSGIVSTDCCQDTTALTGIFDRWVRTQAAKAAQKAYN